MSKNEVSVRWLGHWSGIGTCLAKVYIKDAQLWAELSRTFDGMMRPIDRRDNSQRRGAFERAIERLVNAANRVAGINEI